MNSELKAIFMFMAILTRMDSTKDYETKLKDQNQSRLLIDIIPVLTVWLTLNGYTT